MHVVQDQIKMSITKREAANAAGAITVLSTAIDPEGETYRVLQKIQTVLQVADIIEVENEN